MPAISYARFQSEVLEIYEATKQPATCHKVRQVLAEFAELGLRSAREILPVTVARWIKAHPYRSPATASSLLGAFSAACSVGVASGYLKASPFAFKTRWIALPAEDDVAPKKHHPAKEIARVLRLLDREARAGGWQERRLRALAYTVALTGIRKMEALGLEREDIDLKARMIRLRPNRWRKLKTPKSARPVAIPDQLLPVLRDWLNGRPGDEPAFPNEFKRSTPWTGGVPGHKPLDRLSQAGVRAGVRGLTFQSLRHSWATHAETLWDFTDPMIARNLRHTTERTSKDHYRHPDEANLRAACRKVRYV